MPIQNNICISAGESMDQERNDNPTTVRLYQVCKSLSKS